MYRLTTSLPYVVNRAGVRMGELFALRLRPYGLTVPTYRVLAVLTEAGDRRLGDLAEATGIEISTLSRLVGAMKADGLLSRTRNPGDERTVVINLTARGAALARELIPLGAHHEAVAMRGIPAEEIAALKATLAKVYANLDALEAEYQTLAPEAGTRRPA